MDFHKWFGFRCMIDTKKKKYHERVGLINVGTKVNVVTTSHTKNLKFNSTVMAVSNVKIDDDAWKNSQTGYKRLMGLYH